MIVLIALAGISCEKDKQFSDIPQITDLRITTSPDTALLIDFRDGDGNIGLDQNDTMPPFDVDSEYHNNLINRFFIAEGDEWVRYEFENEMNGRVPNVTPTGQNKALEGTIRFEPLELFLFFNDLVESSDSVRIDTYIYDRDLNKSNVASVVYIY